MIVVHLKRTLSLIAFIAICLAPFGSSAQPANAHVNDSYLLTAMAEGTTLDATKMGPPPQMQLRPNVKYIESKSDLVDTTNEQLIDSLPLCPKNPTDCPDLNGGGRTQASSANCPDVCIAMREDKKAESIEFNGYTIFTKAGEVEGQAYCPPTYTAIGVAKNMPDLSFSNPGPALINIDAREVVDKALQYNYNCHPDGVDKNTPKVKTGGTLPDKSLYCPGDFLGFGKTYSTSAQPDNHTYDYYKNPALGTVYVVKLTEYVTDSMNNTCQVAAGTLAGLALAAATMAGIATGGAAGGAIVGGALVDTDALLGNDSLTQSGDSGVMCSRCSGPASNPNYDATYQLIQCDAPAGWYPTNTESPHGTICTRVRSEWKSLENE